MKLIEFFCRKNKNEEVIRLPQTDKERIEVLEKEVEKLKKFNDKCRCKDVYKRYETIHKWWLGVVALAIALVTMIVGVPSIYEAVSSDRQIDEITDLTQTYKYVVLAGQTGYDEEKIKYYTAAIERTDDDPDLYYMRAKAYFDYGEDEFAIRDCGEALKIDSNYKDAYYLRGRIYFDNGNYDKAIEDFYKHIPLNFEHYHSMYVGYSYYYQNKYEQALPYLYNRFPDRLVEDTFGDNYNENLDIVISECYKNIGKYEKAIRHLGDFYEEHLNRDGTEFSGEKLMEIYEASGDQKSYKEIEKMVEELIAENKLIEENEDIVFTIGELDKLDLLRMELMKRFGIKHK